MCGDHRRRLVVENRERSRSFVGRMKLLTRIVTILLWHLLDRLSIQVQSELLLLLVERVWRFVRAVRVIVLRIDHRLAVHCVWVEFGLHRMHLSVLSESGSRRRWSHNLAAAIYCVSVHRTVWMAVRLSAGLLQFRHQIKLDRFSFALTALFRQGSCVVSNQLSNLEGLSSKIFFCLVFDFCFSNQNLARKTTYLRR